MLKLDCYFTTDVGRVRNNNEDNFYLNGYYKRAAEDDRYFKKDFIYEGGVFAVCDGMGGEEYGEKAALVAVEALKAYQNKEFSKYADEFLDTANKRICELIEENNGVRSGSTLALLDICNDRAVSYNIGDSRVYLFRNNTLTQISEDHTQLARMIKMGVISKEKAANHKDKHVLTQHLGIFPDELVICPYKSKEIEIKNDDIFLLCSDGLNDMLSDEQIEAVLKNRCKPADYANTLKEMALENGGKDNITIGVIKAITDKKGLLHWFRRFF